MAQSLEPDIALDDVVASESADDDRRALRILLIEDDRPTAVALHRLLAMHGHIVLVADSLSMAEEIVCTATVDVLLSDLQLFGESALEAPRRVAEAARRCGRSAPPAIVLSGFASEDDLLESRAAGFAAHLVKPIDEQSLLQALRHATVGDAAARTP
jgi:CheY-like chemotaxis protein